MIDYYFHSAKKCATLYPEGARMNDYKCCHTVEERQFISTCTHLELNCALNSGYKVTKIFRAMTWKDNQWSNDIFTSYISEFMKIKIESSGYPEGIETEEEKLLFI